MPAKLSPLANEVRTAALSYPGAYEDFPWGDRCYKVGKKIFLFLGGEGDSLSVGMKLPQSSEMALMVEGVEPTRYNLGKSGWITAKFPKAEDAPMEMILAWVEEGYRAIAPKKLIKELDARAAPLEEPAKKARKGKAP